ncbi:hypothetical protein QFC24_006138 [Naganishia onofrii]|uniref:Uncharacterized protein n=1 Tax=Naganishia onofrii TaxID=1851511 RepID=A0ACC2X535_9TREE|nr:hypothetical protein QFC24_006138 [Naganishia onofrii]
MILSAINSIKNVRLVQMLLSSFIAQAIFGASDKDFSLSTALMEAYMRPDVQNELKNRKYLDFKEGEDAEKFTPSWDHMLYGKEDREAFATQEARVKLAKAAMYLLTGLKADGQVVGKYSDIPGPSAKPDKVLQGGDLEPDTNNQYILVKGNGKPYIINGPTLVLTKDGGLRALYDDGQDWLLLDSRARLYPGDTKDVYKTRPSEDSGKDTEAFDRLLYNETPRNAIGIAADGMEKLNKVKQGDPTEISKFIKHPENFLFGVKAGVLGRRRDSATGPYVSRRTARA